MASTALTIRQTNFSGGEISPNLQQHTDIKGYGVALKQLENFFVTKHAVIQNRAGFVVTLPVKSNLAGRLVPFIFSADQAYFFEFTNLLVRIFKAGFGYLVNTDHGTGYDGGTTYAKGVLVSSSGIVYRSRLAGNIGHSPASNPTWWQSQGWSDGEIELVTPWTTADLQSIRYSQLNDLLTVTCDRLPPQEILRHADNWWDIGEWAVVPPGIGAMIGMALSWLAADAGHPVNGWWDIIVLGVGADGREESYFSAPREKGLLRSRYAPDASHPAGAHGASFNFASFLTAAVAVRIYIGGLGVFGLVATTRVQLLGTDKWQDIGEPPDFSTAPPEGRNPFPSLSNWAALTAYVTRRMVLNGGNTYECITTGTSAASGGPTGTSQDITDGTVHWRYVWAGTYARNPKVSCYHEQRRVFANTEGQPQTFWGSKIGDPWGFERMSFPPKITDPYEFAVASQGYEEIRWLASIRGLVIGTARGVWFATSGDGQPLSVLNVQLRQLCVRPCANLEPLVIGSRILFLQQSSACVRELNFNRDTDAYDSPDVAIYSSHLFDGYTILRWAYSATPNPTVWAVRDDGVMLCCAYIPEQEMRAWSRIVTAGTFEDVTVISEGGEDVVYVIVMRDAVRYVERLATRAEPDPDLAVFLDGAFVAEDVTPFDSLVVPDSLASKVVTLVLDGAEYPNLTVGIQGSPNVLEFPNGITGSKAIVGIPYSSTLELLDVQTPGEETNTNQKMVDKVNFDVVQTRGVSAGEDVAHLSEWPQRNVPMGYGHPTLQDGKVQVRIRSSWNSRGTAVLRQDRPFAATVVAVSRDLTVGGND